MLEGQNLGPFAVEKEIGAGAMGAVYLARYTKNGQLVAIKLMAPGLGSSENGLARFEREASILKQLNHPNIVRLYATGRFHGNPFYAMEYVQGESLDKVFARRGRLTWEEVVALGQQLCAGLQHAHEQGIVHRDLKPSNLMVLPDGTLKLTDFGIARDLDETRLTATHATVGTAAYMSPEQCRGDPQINYKSDLYSLGIVFYELVTGRKPFLCETVLEMFQMHVSGTCERPSRLIFDVPIWLDTLICQLMEKSPEQRPRDAAAVAQALERIMEKVTAQQSAGVEAVKARAIDRPRGAPQPDQEDREAARELRAAMGKKRGKRKAVPFYRRVWVQALGILAALTVVVGLIVLALQPPSADRLFRQGQRAMESKDPDVMAEARGGAMTQFLELYPDDPRADQVREWTYQVDVPLLEYRLNRLFLSHEGQIIARLKPESPIEQTALDATLAEDSGDLAVAKRGWEELVKHAQDLNLRPWSRIAKKHLDDLKEIDYLEGQLRRQIDDEGNLVPDFKPAKGFESQAIEAFQSEATSRRATAHKEWEKLKKATQGKSDKERQWYLLASKRIRDLSIEKEEPRREK